MNATDNQGVRRQIPRHSNVPGQSIEPTHPAYEGTCRDLLAYFEAVRLKRTFAMRVKSQNPNRLLQGERLAREYNCFQCHGELGQGGFRNAGALKGYIPGYFGDDFAQLTRGGNAESIRAWISQGIDPALIRPSDQRDHRRVFYRAPSCQYAQVRDLVRLKDSDTHRVRDCFEQIWRNGCNKYTYV